MCFWSRGLRRLNPAEAYCGGHAKGRLSEGFSRLNKNSLCCICPRKYRSNPQAVEEFFWGGGGSNHSLSSPGSRTPALLSSGSPVAPGSLVPTHFLLLLLLGTCSWWNRVGVVCGSGLEGGERVLFYFSLPSPFQFDFSLGPLLDVLKLCRLHLLDYSKDKTTTGCLYPKPQAYILFSDWE